MHDENHCADCGAPISRGAKRCAACAKTGVTPERRSQHPLCGAKKKNGEPCRAYSGQNTDHFGTGKCWLHGGRTTSHKQHAVAVEAQRRMVTFGTPIADVTGPSALMGLLQATAGHVEYLRESIAAMDAGDLTSEHDGAVLTRLYADERDRLARVAEACVRAGVSEAMVRLAESQAMLLQRALQVAMEEVGLTKEQRAALGPALRNARAVLTGDDGDVIEGVAVEPRAATARTA